MIKNRVKFWHRDFTRNNSGQISKVEILQNQDILSCKINLYISLDSIKVKIEKIRESFLEGCGEE